MKIERLANSEIVIEEASCKTSSPKRLKKNTFIALIIQIKAKLFTVIFERKKNCTGTVITGSNILKVKHLNSRVKYSVQ